MVQRKSTKEGAKRMADMLVYPVRLERDVYERLKIIAAREDRTAAQVIRRALRDQTKLIEAAEKSPVQPAK